MAMTAKDMIKKPKSHTRVNDLTKEEAIGGFAHDELGAKPKEQYDKMAELRLQGKTRLVRRVENGVANTINTKKKSPPAKFVWVEVEA